MSKSYDKLAKRLAKILREDVLNKYDTEDYWEPMIFVDFQQEHALTDEEMETVKSVMMVEKQLGG